MHSQKIACMCVHTRAYRTIIKFLITRLYNSWSISYGCLALSFLIVVLRLGMAGNSTFPLLLSVFILRQSDFLKKMYGSLQLAPGILILWNHLLAFPSLCWVLWDKSILRSGWDLERVRRLVLGLLPASLPLVYLFRGRLSLWGLGPPKTLDTAITAS